MTAELHILSHLDFESKKSDHVQKYAVDTTSHSKNWSKGLSPFFLGPVDLYDGHVSLNMENAWQFSKAYSKFVTRRKEVKDSYWKWAKKGWASERAYRYPMGKGATPEFSLWKGDRLGYVEARKKIYIPLYYKAVINTDAFKQLQELYLNQPYLYLFDWDGYDHKNFERSYGDVINNKKLKLGHSFVLGAMLEHPEETLLQIKEYVPNFHV